jgi:HSP20 family molecular chaperone IbpA
MRPKETGHNRGGEPDVRGSGRRRAPLPVAAVTCNGAWLPAVDVRELPDEYIVLADLPGLKPGDVDVTWDDNILTIAGARRDRLHTGGVPFRLERPTGRLLRSLRLPDGCDGAELEAHIRDGVLEVRIPRAARTIRNATSDVNLCKLEICVVCTESRARRRPPRRARYRSFAGPSLRRDRG